jgi:DNA-binding MarR family transcriptional regulator
LKKKAAKSEKNQKTETSSEFTPCYCANIRWISREVTQFYKNLIEPSGIYSTQYTLLSFLKIEGSLTMNQFAQLSHLDRTTLVRNLKSLEKSGLISYTHEGTSIKLVQLTDKGQEKLVDADPRWDKAQELFRSQLNEREWAYFNKILLKLSKINEPSPGLTQEIFPD